MKDKISVFLLIAVITILLTLNFTAANDFSDNSTIVQDNFTAENYNGNNEIQKIINKNSRTDMVKTSQNVDVKNYRELLRQIDNAKNSSVDSYTINLKPGNYNASSSVIWGNGSGKTRELIINGNGITLNGKRKYQFISVYEGYTLNLNNIVLSNFTTNFTRDKIINHNGSAINNSGNVNINNSSIIYCRAYDYGNVYNRGNLSVNNSIFYNNRASLAGGVIVNDGIALVDNSNFFNNYAHWGGSIYNRENQILIRNCNFTNSSSNSGGGAVCYQTHKHYNPVINCIFNNCSGYQGGALLDVNNIINCTFINNTGNGIVASGGSVSMYGYNNSLIVNSIFINSYSNYSGGAVRIYGNGIIDNCTFINCTSLDSAGAITGYADYYLANLTLSNSTFINVSSNTMGAIRGFKYLNVSDCNFINTTATNGNGGAIGSTSHLRIFNTTFTNTTAKNNGGAIYTNMNLYITDSNFINTRSDMGGAICHQQLNRTYPGDEYLSIIKNCNFIKTQSNNYGSVYSKNFTIENSTFGEIYPFNFIIVEEDDLFFIKENNSEKYFDIRNASIYVDNELTYTGLNISNYILPYGNHTIKLVIDSINETMKNDVYLINYTTTDVKIKITNVTESRYKDNLTIKGTLKRNTKAFADAEIEIFINNNKYLAKTDNNGVYTLTIRVMTPGTNNISVFYRGDSRYNPCNTSTTISILRKDTKLTLNKIDDVKYNDNITISGIFTNADGEALINSVVNIRINNETQELRTDNKGRYSLTTQVLTTGTNNITVFYKGNSKYNPYNISTTINVIKKDTKITIKKIYSGKINDNITITGKLKNEDGKALINSNVVVYINDGHHTIKTNNRGIYSYVFTPKMVGEYNITVEYKGNTKYNPSNTTTILIKVQE